MNRNDLPGIVRTKKAVIFDLFHTLTALETAWGDGRPMTHQVLGVSKEAWHTQLLECSRDRLVGKMTDPFAIIASINRDTIFVLARNFVESYLNQHLSKKLADKYLSVFDFYFSEIESPAGKETLRVKKTVNATIVIDVLRSLMLLSLQFF